MLYRVIIAAGGDTECPNGTYVRTSVSPSIPSEAEVGDGLTLRTHSAAEMVRSSIARRHPSVTYHIRYSERGGSDWDAIAREYSHAPTSEPVDDEDEDDEDEDEVRCEDCGEEGHTEWGHRNYYCQSCDWSCDIHECAECVSYGPDGDCCESCAVEQHSQGSPGLRLTRCTTCDSYDVHHDDVAERFVCDHVARDLVAQRRPVTLAHELPAADGLAVAV